MTRTDDDPVLRVATPADLVHAVPYLLGFHPAESLVLVGLRQRQVLVTARLDLDDVREADGALVAETLERFCVAGVDALAALLFADVSESVAAPELPLRRDAAVVQSTARRADLDVTELLLVTRGRFWSYRCEGGACCPAEGTPLAEGSRIAADATFAGLVALPDRQAVEAQLRPDPDRWQLTSALVVAEDDAMDRILRHGADREDRAVVRALFGAARACEVPGARCAPDDARLTRWAVALRRYPARDALWLGIDDRRLDGRTLWRDMARRLPPPYDAPPLFLFGWASWRAGDGVLAGIAAEAALCTDPSYSAADLLLTAVVRGISPDSVPRLRPSRRHRRGAADSGPRRCA